MVLDQPIAPTEGIMNTVEQLISAINSGDSGSVLRLVDDEITVTEPDGGSVHGRGDFGALLTKMIALHADLRLTQPQITGETVKGIMLIANDYHRKVGIAPLSLDWQAEVHAGRVKSFGGTFTAAALEKLRTLRDAAVHS
jgi:hypothetical protein